MSSTVSSSFVSSSHSRSCNLFVSSTSRHGAFVRRSPFLVSLPGRECRIRRMTLISVVASSSSSSSSSATAEVPEKSGAQGKGKVKGFVDEMRAVAMQLHTKDQARQGEKESVAPPVAKWEPSVRGYLSFLVDSKVVYDALDAILLKASHPWSEDEPRELDFELGHDRDCVGDDEFRNTGLERSGSLAKDLEWFKEQGNDIPEPSSPGISYARYLEELSERDPQAFICHFYNIYFAHTAGGRMIGKKVAEKILDNKELEFYKWDGDLSQHLQNVRDKLNIVALNWSREEKNHCLEETEKSFKYSGEMLRLILSES